MSLRRKFASVAACLGLVLSAVTLGTATSAPAQAAGCSYCWGMFQNNDMYGDALNGHAPPVAIQYLSWNPMTNGPTGPITSDIDAAAAEGIGAFLELQTNCSGCSTATDQGFVTAILDGNANVTANLKAFGATIASDEQALGGDEAQFVFLTFDHEPNEPSGTCADDWYPWGTACESPADWIKAWNIVTADIDSTCGGWCTWVWAPNVGADSSIASYWSNSGNQVQNVDWKGLDCYLRQGQTWSNTCASSWVEVSSLTGGGTEFGTILTETGVNQTDTNPSANTQLSEIVNGVGSGYVFYFDEDKGAGMNWSLTSGEATCFLSLEGVSSGTC
jgi:hypothetical protein